MNLQDITTTAETQLAIDEEIRAILIKEYGLLDEKNKGGPYEAVGLLAVDVAIRLMNVLRSMRFPDAKLGYRTVLDLTIGLNSNAFWQKNATVLVPLLHIAVQAQADYAFLLLDKATNRQSGMFDKVRIESELVGLELFVMIGYLLGGQELMTNSSIKIKSELEPYLVS